MLHLRPTKLRAALLKTALLIVCSFVFLISLVPSTSTLIRTLVTDTLYNHGLVHSPPIVCDDCFTYSPVYTIDTPHLCKDPVFLLILVSSRPNNSSHRQAIRETWASRTTVRGLGVRVAFLTGQVKDSSVQMMLHNESRHFEDIIQADFADTYRNLTYKSVTVLQWTMRSCSNAKYLLKTDDDTFVNIERVVAYLRNLKPSEDFIGGNCFTSRPIRDPKSKWYVKPKEYTKSHFPMYCNGFAYVMPLPTVAKLVAVQPNVPFLYIEDVYITGMCRNVLQIPYRNMISFVPDLHHVRSLCDFVYYVSTAHYVNESMLYSLSWMMNDPQFINDCLERRTIQVSPGMLLGILVVLGLGLYAAFRRMNGGGQPTTVVMYGR